MKIGVIGLGYVGLPLAVAVAFAEEGHEVVALDADTRKVEALRSGHSYVEDVRDDALRPIADALRPTNRYTDLASCHAVIICVPTPLTSSREPDPHVPQLGELDLSSSDLSAALAAADLVAIVTAHPEVDYERVVADAQLVVDFRGVTRGIAATNLVRL